MEPFWLRLGWVSTGFQVPTIAYAFRRGASSHPVSSPSIRLA